MTFETDSKRYIDALSKFSLPRDSEIESLPDKNVGHLEKCPDEPEPGERT